MQGTVYRLTNTLIEHTPLTNTLIEHTPLTNTLIEQSFLPFGLVSVRISGVRISEDSLYTQTYTYNTQNTHHDKHKNNN